MTPTPEQRAIIDAITSTNTSIMVQAYAGCAKTSTLVMAANAISVPGLALAFNVKIKKELEERFPPNFTVMTLNGLGHKAWAKTIRKFPLLEAYKIGNITTEFLKKEPSFNDSWGDIKDLVTNAMRAGLVPLVFPQKSLIPDTMDSWLSFSENAAPDPKIIQIAREVLITSIYQAFGKGIPEPIISFDDQIYMSTLFGGDFPRYSLVMVDEAQDLSPLNHLQLKACSAGRLIAVGDVKQAIYGFRGADQNSMVKMKALKPEWIDLSLTTTFRCPRVLVNRQQQHAPGFTSAATNEEGEFISHKSKWGIAWLESKAVSPHEKIAIICRNNAPIFKLALQLLTQNVPCVLVGRDLGKNLTKLAKTIIPTEVKSKEACESLVQSWLDNECAQATANKQSYKIHLLRDKAECLFALLTSPEVVDRKTLIDKLDELLVDVNSRISLMTGHKSKGLEWPIVVHLNPDSIPSKWAMLSADEGHTGQLQQEMNIKYVIETRAQRILIELDMSDFTTTERIAQ